jgi:hypothetical protein
MRLGQATVNANAVTMNSESRAGTDRPLLAISACARGSFDQLAGNAHDFGDLHTGMLCSAALTEEQLIIRGVGTASCAKFGSMYKEDERIAFLVFDSWAQGFMSGPNAELYIKREPMRGIPSPENHFARIRQVCDQCPLANFVDVVIEYFISLPIPPQRSK